MSAPPAAGAAPFPRDIETDVCVIGGGVLGSSTAYFLACEGVEVVLVERQDINANASGRNAGSLHVQMQSAQAKNTDPVWMKGFDDALPLYLEAVRTWQQIADEADCDIEVRFCGGLMVAEDERQLRFLEAKIKRERARGLDTSLVLGADLRRMAPYLSEHIPGAEYCPHEGKLNPTLATPAIARGAERAGARLFRRTAVMAIEPRNEGFIVATNRGRIRAKRVVNAAGPWGLDVSRMVGIQFPNQQSPIHMNVTEPAAPFLEHLIEHADRHLTMKQVANGNVLVGGGWPAHWEPGMDQPQVLRRSIEGSLWLGQHVVPQLGQLRLLRTWTGINVLIDGKPLLGEVPRLKGFFHALTSTGYTLGPVCGKLVSEIMRGKAPSFDVTPFLIERFDYMRSR